MQTIGAVAPQTDRAAVVVPAAARATPVRLDRAISGDAALQRIGLACLGQIQRNEAAVLAGSAAGIHQMRVAVRRLRAVLAAFGTWLPDDERRWASRELRRLADTLEEARDLDVFEALLSPVRAAGVAPAAVKVLAAAAERRRGAAPAATARVVGLPHYAAVMLRLSRWLHGRSWQRSRRSAPLRQPVAILADRILDRQYRAVRRRGKGFAGQSARQRHRLRIALKKLRYSVEALGGVYAAGDVAPFLKRVKRLQNALGAANDLRLGRRLVAQLAKTHGDGPVITAAGEAVLGWHGQRLARKDKRLRKRVRRLLARKPFWAD